MKAKIKYRVNIENHVKLGTIIPLDTPFVLLIDPSNLCNMKCKFCPTGNKDLIRSTGRYNGFLGFDIYKKFIDDTKDFTKKIKTLRLYKEGEPLLNPKFSDMVSYAKKSNLFERIDTTTNGVLFSPKLNRSIIGAGIDQINISVNGVSSERIYFYTKNKVNFKSYVENIRDLYENRGNCEVSIKAIEETLTEDEKKSFFDIFGNISNRIVLEHISPAWPEFIFHEDIKMEYKTGNYGQKIIERKVCPYIFYIMVINSDGRCSTCVGDWPNKQIVGDARIQTLKEIWNGSILNEYRSTHLKGNRNNIKFCKECEVVKYGTLDNIDDYADEILKKMEKV